MRQNRPLPSTKDNPRQHKLALESMKEEDRSHNSECDFRDNLHAYYLKNVRGQMFHYLISYFFHLKINRLLSYIAHL